MKSRHQAAIGLLMASTAVGCGGFESKESTATLSDATEPLAEVDSTTRHAVAHVSFSIWEDIVQMDAAVTKDGEQCRFAKPQVEDDTTTWNPLQIYWLMWSGADQESTQATLADTYFDGDLVEPSRFAELAGGDAPDGFRALSGLNRMFVKIDNIELSESGEQLSGVFTVPRLNIPVAFKTEATLSEAGSCEVVSSYCQKDESACEQASEYAPLTNIHVEMKEGLLGPKVLGVGYNTL